MPLMLALPVAPTFSADCNKKGKAFISRFCVKITFPKQSNLKAPESHRVKINKNVRSRPLDRLRVGGMSAAATATRVKVDASGKKMEVSNSKLKYVSVASKQEVKGKAVATTRKTTTVATVKAKSAKKVYTLTGQKYDPPEEREPLRIFYESLSKQIPTSAMAEIWMMEHGLLSPDRAKKAYERKQRKQQQLRTGTPVKSQKSDRPESSKTQLSMSSDPKAKKRVNYSDSDRDEFIIKHKKSKV